MLMAGLNNVGVLWRSSPALQELEETVLEWLAQLLGLPSGLHGHLEEGASISTLAALAAARQARPGARVVVCSEHAHSSVDKAARLLELELRKVPADAEFRLDVASLELTDACAVVATVGTTSCTSVDPVAALAEACEREGVWLHVDAAYAGAAMVCPEFRWAFDGVDRADSVVVNPHKWLFVPQGCSALWTRRPEAFRDTFSLVPEYLRTSDAVVSFSEYSPELGGASARSVCGRCFAATAPKAFALASGRPSGSPRSSSPGSTPSPDGRWRRPVTSRSCASGGMRATRRTRRSCSGSTSADASSSPTPSSTAATSSASRSATRARPRMTSAAPGTS